jgi:hypothetical protein
VYNTNQATIKENEDLSTFYRLLTRTAQAVKMMSILQELPRLKMNWSSLKGITFQQIVSEKKSHDIIKKALKNLVCDIKAKDNGILLSLAWYLFFCLTLLS